MKLGCQSMSTWFGIQWKESFPGIIMSGQYRTKLNAWFHRKWSLSFRAPWYFVERKRAFPDLPLPNPNWLRKDFDTCVRRGDKECQYQEGDERDDFGQLTEFFCGQDDECTWVVWISHDQYLGHSLIKYFRGFNTEIALRKAKENVEKHYAVVGVLEEMNKTLTVLEHYVPRYFKGAKDIYWSKFHTKVNKNRSAFQHFLLQTRSMCSPELTETFISRQFWRKPKT